MDDVVIGIDAGSTSIKVVALDRATGATVAAESAPTPRIVPAPGRIEIDVTALVDIAFLLIRRLPASVRQATAALGVTGQMCTAVLVGADDQPTGPAHSIFDNRCADETAALAAECEHVLEHEGNEALSIHTLPKLMWISAHQPDHLATARRIVCVKDAVRAALTHDWSTDPSDASGTLLYNQRTDCWDTELIERCHLPVNLFGGVQASDTVAGDVSSEAAARTGLRRNVPVATGAADMAAVGVGVGARTGDVVINVGTAGQVIAPASSLARGLWPVQQYRYAGHDRHYRFGAVFSAGLALDWLLKLFGASWSGPPMNLPSDTDPATAPLFMPYLAGAGAPHYRPDAAAAFTGLRVGHDRADMFAAVVHGVAIEIASVLSSVAPDAVGRLILTGGASRFVPLVRAVAAATGRPIERTIWEESAGVGAARLAVRALSDHQTDFTVPVSQCEPGQDEVAFFTELSGRYQTAAAAVRDLPTGASCPV